MRENILLQGEPKKPNPRDRFEALPAVRSFARRAGDVMSPMRWTAVRAPLAVATLAVAPYSLELAAAMYGANALLDYLDGLVARATGQTSVEGAKLDPLMDKLVNSGTLLYLIPHAHNPMFWATALISIGIDLKSQKQRGPILEQLRLLLKTLQKDFPLTHASDPTVQANWFGKVKTALQSLAIAPALYDPTLATYSAGVLGASVISGYVGTKMRQNVTPRSKLVDIPRVPLTGNTEILFTPESFRKNLLEAISKESKRIYISALYITPDEAGQEIVDALVKAKQENPNLDIKVLVDFHRNQRGRIGERGAKTALDLFREANAKLPVGQKIDFLGVPVATKEGAGVLHTKGIVVGNRLFYSGASLNNVYLNKQGEYRLDRYFVFHDEEVLTDLIADYLGMIAKHEAVRSLDGSRVVVDKELRAKILDLRKRLKSFSQSSIPAEAKHDEAQALFLAGLGKGNLVSQVIENMLAATETGDDVTLYTPYFNPTKKLRRLIASALDRGAVIDLVVGDKQANDFYRDPDKHADADLSVAEAPRLSFKESITLRFLDALPYVYEKNLKKFVKEHRIAIEKGLLNIHVWQDGTNTYHAKGLSINSGSAVLITGHNKNSRGDLRDAENGILILNPGQALRAQLSQEKAQIFSHTKRITSSEDLPSSKEYPLQIRRTLGFIPTRYI